MSVARSLLLTRHCTTFCPTTTMCLLTALPRLALSHSMACPYRTRISSLPYPRRAVPRSGRRPPPAVRGGALPPTPHPPQHSCVGHRDLQDPRTNLTAQ